MSKKSKGPFRQAHRGDYTKLLMDWMETYNENFQDKPDRIKELADHAQKILEPVYRRAIYGK